MYFEKLYDIFMTLKMIKENDNNNNLIYIFVNN